jgi:hypothetical protein
MMTSRVSARKPKQTLFQQGLRRMALPRKSSNNKRDLCKLVDAPTFRRALLDKKL